MENYNKPSSELTKLEYALIHSNWYPTKDDIETQGRYDKQRNQYNEPHKPPLRSQSEIIKDLRTDHFKLMLE